MKHREQSFGNRTDADNPLSSALLVVHAERTIRRFGMLTAGDAVLVAVSGGPDSVALLHVLLALRVRFKLNLAVVHINHALRGAASEDEEEQVAALARKHALRLHSARLDVSAGKGSLEERARNARHAIFENLADTHGYARVALGHQADDNAETVLMNLLRGSGSRGLAGIPPVRRRIIRPLIESRRFQILNYLRELAVPYAVDATNADTRFVRNRIRHRMIPLLEQQYNGRIVHVLNRTADLYREEEAFWEEYLRPLISQVRLTAQNGLEVPLRLLAQRPRSIQRRLLREALRLWHGDLRRIGMDHVDKVIEMLGAPSGAGLRLPHFILVRHEDGRLHFQKAPRRVDRSTAVQPTFNGRVESPEVLPHQLEIPESGARLEFRIVESGSEDARGADGVEQAWFDLDRLTFPLHVRWAASGDRLQPYGMAGRQKVGDLLRNRKVPLAQRRRIPILLCGDTPIWLVGVRRASAAPVSGRTQRILRVCRIANPPGNKRPAACNLNKDG